MSAGQVTDVFAKIRARLEKTLAELPATIGTEAVNYSLDAFTAQGWEGEPWQERQSKKDAGRNILIKSTRLMKSVRIIRTTANSVTIGTDVPYARIHNYGGVINKPERTEDFVRNRYTKGPKAKMFGGMGAFKKGTTPGKGQTIGAHVINMPQRQFIGYSKRFHIAMRNVAREEIKKGLGLAA